MKRTLLNLISYVVRVPVSLFFFSLSLATRNRRGMEEAAEILRWSNIMENTSPKVYVAVTALHNADGSIKPLKIIWEDGREYEIDKVLDVRKAASQKAGGNGIRYTVRIQGKERHLYDELNGKWFMERK